MDVERATVIHAYGIVRSEAEADLPATGVAGSGLALLDAGEIAAVFSILPEARYGDAAWREHAQDAQWLAKVAIEHQRVLGELITDCDVLPLRLPGMYADECQLHRMLQAEAPLFSAVLEAVHDHVEWGVQLFFAGEEVPEEPRPTSGREYLQRRSDAAARREMSRARRQQRVRETYAVLADLSRQSVANPLQDPALTGRPEPMLLNSAHLVARRHERLFFAAVEESAARLAPAGVIVETSGPWPPYNFVEIPVGEVQAPS